MWSRGKKLILPFPSVWTQSYGKRKADNNGTSKGGCLLLQPAKNKKGHQFCFAPTAPCTSKSRWRMNTMEGEISWRRDLKLLKNSHGTDWCKLVFVNCHRLYSQDFQPQIQPLRTKIEKVVDLENYPTFDFIPKSIQHLVTDQWRCFVDPPRAPSQLPPSPPSYEEGLPHAGARLKAELKIKLNFLIMVK